MWVPYVSRRSLERPITPAGQESGPCAAIQRQPHHNARTCYRAPLERTDPLPAPSALQERFPFGNMCARIDDLHKLRSDYQLPLLIDNDAQNGTELPSPAPDAVGLPLSGARLGCAGVGAGVSGCKLRRGVLHVAGRGGCVDHAGNGPSCGTRWTSAVVQSLTVLVARPAGEGVRCLPTSRDPEKSTKMAARAA